MGASSYNIYKSTDSVHFVLLKNVKDNFFYDSSVTEGANYYRIKSVSINGETPNYSSTTVRYRNGVQNLTVTAAGDSLKLQWSRFLMLTPTRSSYSDTNGYTYYSDEISDTFISLSLSESGTYYFRVKPICPDTLFPKRH